NPWANPSQSPILKKETTPSNLSISARASPMLGTSRATIRRSSIVLGTSRAECIWSAASGNVVAQPLLALGRPHLIDLVIDSRERACAFGRIEPGPFASRENMEMGRDRRWVIQRTGADEKAVPWSSSIPAPQSRATAFAKKHFVGLSAPSGQLKRLRRNRTR